MILNNIGRGKKICMLCSNTKMHCFIFFLEEKIRFRKLFWKKQQQQFGRLYAKLIYQNTQQFPNIQILQKKVHTPEKKIETHGISQSISVYTYWYVCAGGLGEGEGLEKHFAAHVWKQFCRPGIPKDDNDSSYASICLYSTHYKVYIAQLTCMYVMMSSCANELLCSQHHTA